MGRALKRFHEIEKHFADFFDDQFDFHGYAARKGTVRAYVEMLRWADKLRDHPFYFSAAVAAAKVYLSLFDHPELKTAKDEPEEFANMTEADKKKALKKARKQELRAAEEKIEPKAKGEWWFDICPEPESSTR
ncbi:hypothetical protein HDU93_006365 [Gonapodya sp. JEL0774]|nr:hypothetical protein HDU93_006365 [Gonapodya sp. JEL0774]